LHACRSTLEDPTRFTEGNTRTSEMARMRRSAGVFRPRHAETDVSKNLGSPNSSWKQSGTGRRWSTVKGKKPLEAIGVSYQA